MLPRRGPLPLDFGQVAKSLAGNLVAVAFGSLLPRGYRWFVDRPSGRYMPAVSPENRERPLSRVMFEPTALRGCWASGRVMMVLVVMPSR